MSNRIQMNKKVIQAAESILYEKQWVSFVDVLIKIGTLSLTHLEDWRKGRIPYLEKVIQGNLSKISFAMKCFRAWANRKGLKSSQTVYLRKTKGPKTILRFSKSGHPQIEKAYATHFLAMHPKEENVVSVKKQERVKIFHLD